MYLFIANISYYYHYMYVGKLFKGLYVVIS